ncbi:CBS domain-containing protein|nr:CBS domain-containing protein [Candidatus Bathyarchaeota archaeon]
MIPRVRHVMKRDPLTLDETYTVTEAARMMVDYAMDTLIITYMGNILGAITYRDLIRYLIQPGVDPDDTVIGELVDSDVVLVRPSTTLEDAIILMLETGKNTLPVVDSEIVGYIGYTDILRMVNRIEAVATNNDDQFDPRKFIV